MTFQFCISFILIYSIFGTISIPRDCLEQNINATELKNTKYNRRTSRNLELEYENTKQNFRLSSCSIMEELNDKVKIDGNENICTDLDANRNPLIHNMNESNKAENFNLKNNEIFNDFDFLNGIHDPYISNIEISDYLNTNNKYDNDYFAELEDQRKIKLDADYSLKKSTNDKNATENHDSPFLAASKNIKIDKPQNEIAVFVPKENILADVKGISKNKNYFSIKTYEKKDQIRKNQDKLHNYKERFSKNYNIEVAFINLGMNNIFDKYLKSYCQNVKLFKDLLYINAKMKNYVENRLISYIKNSETINFFLQNGCLLKNNNTNSIKLRSSTIYDQICTSLLLHEDFIYQFLKSIDKNEKSFRNTKHVAQYNIYIEIESRLKEKKVKVDIENSVTNKIFSYHEIYYKIIHLKLISYIFRFVTLYIKKNKIEVFKDLDDEIVIKCTDLLQIAKNFTI